VELEQLPRNVVSLVVNNELNRNTPHDLSVYSQNISSMDMSPLNITTKKMQQSPTELDYISQEASIMEVINNTLDELKIEGEDYRDYKSKKAIRSPSWQ